MKKILISLIFIAAVHIPNAMGQMTVKDSIQTFYDSMFYQLEKVYLFKDSVDWKTVKSEFIDKAMGFRDFESSLSLSKNMFDTIGCGHCMLFSENGYYPATQRPLLFENYSEQFIKKYTSGVEFEVRRLQDEYGYIMMPGMLFNELSEEELNQKAQAMYDKITQVDLNEKIKGWIVDLRFNTGGDAYLMLTALYHLLGDQVVYNELNFQKQIVQVNKLHEGKFYSGDSIQREIKVSNPPNTEAPISLIIGNWTASAGEDIILAFKDRSNVTTIGEPTYGFLTGNDMFNLPFNIKAALTISYVADINGHYYEKLEPNIYIKSQDNFENLLSDGNVKKAIEFINKKQRDH